MTKNGGVSVGDYRHAITAKKSNNSNCWRPRPVCAGAAFDRYYHQQKNRAVLN